MDAKTLARFWAKVDVAGPDDCWLWTAARTQTNKPFERRYGKFRWHRRTHATHRLSYLLEHGDYPEHGLLVLHSCHNPPCVNPAHLHAGTYLDNMTEMIAAGRRYDNAGENNGRATLTESMVISIRASHAKGIMPTALGRLHGLHPTTISKIVNRTLWPHI